MAVELKKPLNSRMGRLKFTPIQGERVERKLALTFGFMSFLPVLIIVWAHLTKTDIMIALFGIVACMFIGYFFILRRMLKAVLQVHQKVQDFNQGIRTGDLEVDETNEIGELARTFNRITHDLEHKIHQLESSREQVRNLLSRIGTAIVSYEGIDNLLNLILENSVSALEAQAGSLLLVDGESQHLTIKTTWPNRGSGYNGADAGKPIKMGEGIAGWVAKEGRPMRETTSIQALGIMSSQKSHGTVLCVPLKLRDQSMGVVMVFRADSEKRFTEDEEGLMMNIGSQIAVAIENYRLNLNVEQTYIETIRALAMAVEAKDPYSAGHSKRVGQYAVQIGEKMGLDREALKMLNDAGVLHDIGKIGIKDEILLKPSALTVEEFKIMQQHSVIGHAILKPVRSLAKVAPLVLHHHEHYDGSGYPGGLRGEAIPIGARILTVADSFDAIVTDRPYRKRRTVDEAKAEFQRCAGKDFDPKVVEVLLGILEEKQHRKLQQLA